MRLEIYKVEKSIFKNLISECFEATEPEEDIAVICSRYYVQEILSDILSIDSLALETIDFDLEEDTDYIISISSYGGVFVEGIRDREFYTSKIVMFYKMDKFDYFDYVVRNYETKASYFKIVDEVGEQDKEIIGGEPTDTEDENVIEQKTDNSNDKGDTDNDENKCVSKKIDVFKDKEGNTKYGRITYTKGNGNYGSVTVYTSIPTKESTMHEILKKFSF